MKSVGIIVVLLVLLAALSVARGFIVERVMCCERPPIEESDSGQRSSLEQSSSQSHNSVSTVTTPN